MNSELTCLNVTVSDRGKIRTEFYLTSKPLWCTTSKWLYFYEPAFVACLLFKLVKVQWGLHKYANV